MPAISVVVLSSGKMEIHVSFTACYRALSLLINMYPDYLNAVVTDGVTLGHKCCFIQDCHVPLALMTDRYCPQHDHLKDQCAVHLCTSKALVGSLACAQPEHLKLVELEQKRCNTKRKREQDKRSSRAGEVPDRSHDTTPAAPTKNKARTSHRWTHNEQLVVRPCGVIISRATFYGSESVSATSVSVASHGTDFTNQPLLSGTPQGHLPAMFPWVASLCMCL